eukprot:scaffold17031_cov136-Skeletonema_marinoi.AAC.1
MGRAPQNGIVPKEQKQNQGFQRGPPPTNLTRPNFVEQTGSGAVSCHVTEAEDRMIHWFTIWEANEFRSDASHISRLDNYA